MRECYNGQLFGVAACIKNASLWPDLDKNSCCVCIKGETVPAETLFFVHIWCWLGCIDDLGTVLGLSEAQGSNIYPLLKPSKSKEAAVTADDATCAAECNNEQANNINYTKH